ncbi:response regulator transcription factor [Pontibacillus salicampi]|uniref:Response regulator transcription factor n=1 Tax=Pontibacillus salicampi TaxID=1449801 RepID=A0ABV6LIM3_9BACI
MMEQTKILFVDDDQAIRESVTSYLSNEQFELLEASEGKEAIDIISATAVDLVLLDMMMPGMDGMTCLREIRYNFPALPVIILTAKTDEIDTLLALEMGADDYITKPFSIREVTARVKTLLRRKEVYKGTEVESSRGVEWIERGPVSIDPAAFEVKVNGESLKLTPTEFTLLHTLAEKPERVFSRMQLLSRAMGDAYLQYDRSIDTHMSNLRKKLSDALGEKAPIVTVHGVGYKYGASS